MSKKAKRTISSLSYYINRFYRRVSTTKPSTLILSMTAIAIAAFLFGGGIYDLVMRPYPAIYYNNQFITVDPRLSEQFISDSVFSMILYALGVVGLLAVYQSTKYAYKPRQAYMLFLAGIVLILLSYVFIEATIRMKTGG
jgi:hypothetical protein